MEEVFSNFSTIEIPAIDYEMYRWASDNREAIATIMRIRRARVSFFVKENGKIDRATIEKKEKI